MAKQKPKTKLIKPSTAKLDGKSYYECYYCGGRVNASAAVIKPIALQVVIKDKDEETTKHVTKYIERPFHLDCLQKYVKEHGDIDVMHAENSEWDDVYQYFKREYLKVPAGVSLDKRFSKTKIGGYVAKRLLGLRTGQFMPQGTNTRIIKRGYSFKEILNTLKYCKRSVDYARETVEFNDLKHEVNYFMRIVESKIDFIAMRMLKAEEQKKRVDRMLKQDSKMKQPEPKIEYKHKGTGKRKVEF